MDLDLDAFLQKCGKKSSLISVTFYNSFKLFNGSIRIGSKNLNECRSISTALVVSDDQYMVWYLNAEPTNVSSPSLSNKNIFSEDACPFCSSNQ
jgi:hypothetical protein